MARRIDTQARNEAVRFEEQVGDPAQPAAGYRIVYAKSDGIYEEDDAGVIVGPFGAAGGGDVLNQTVNGRLTLTTATPVTTADVTAATTLYFTPYKGNQIALYDGVSAWELLSFTEKSLDIAAYTASKPYDIWAYNNSGTVALDSTVWTNATTRATALTYQDGIYVKTGATTRRYLGTIYINGSGGQTDDSGTKRFVWNYYNRRLRKAYNTKSSTHSYGTGAWRIWDNDATEIMEFIIGVVEDWVSLNATCYLRGESYSGIGYDVTNAPISSNFYIYKNEVNYENVGVAGSHLPTAGYHYYSSVEYGGTSGSLVEYHMSADILG